MKGLFIVRQGELNQQPAHPQMDALKLLAKQGSLEIMHQHIFRGATVWLSPAPTADEIEFFYICAGELTLSSQGWQTSLTAGDCFHAHDLSADVVVNVQSDTDLLYISTMPVFDDHITYQNELFNLLRQIDEKDHYTLQHSVNVRNYSQQLWSALPERQTASYGDLSLAALFHDVGKCTIPDSILKKPGRCTPEEFEIMKTHASASGELLAHRFPPDVQRFALQHHERLNGSGYPNRISGDEIPFEARVIALADAFDAMTTSRVYNVPKPFIDAARELVALPHLFDQELAGQLLKFVEEGKLVTNNPVKL